MNSAQWRYYALNQLLMGRTFATLPSEAKDAVNSVKDKWDAILCASDPIVLSEVETLFLGYMRAPFYSICSIADRNAPILLKQIVDIVREGKATVNDCINWPYGLIQGVTGIDFGTPCIKDGLVYLSKNQDGEDLDEAMKNAFSLRCTGQRFGETTPEGLKLVKTLQALASPQDSFSLDDGQVAEILDLFQLTGIHPVTLTKTALIINDLRPTLKKYGALAWWRTLDRNEVAVLLPKNKKAVSELVMAVIPVMEFTQLVDSDPQLLSKMHVRGSQVVFT